MLEQLTSTPCANRSQTNQTQEQYRGKQTERSQSLPLGLGERFVHCDPRGAASGVSNTNAFNGAGARTSMVVKGSSTKFKRSITGVTALLLAAGSSTFNLGMSEEQSGVSHTSLSDRHGTRVLRIQRNPTGKKHVAVSVRWRPRVPQLEAVGIFPLAQPRPIKRATG